MAKNWAQMTVPLANSKKYTKTIKRIYRILLKKLRKLLGRVEFKTKTQKIMEM